MIKQEHRNKFKEMGSDKVSEYIHLGHFKGEKLKSAQAWLEEQQREHVRKEKLQAESIQKEQLEIARSAKDAAWAAAKASEDSASEAKDANRLSKWALGVSILAIVVAGFGWLID